MAFSGEELSHEERPKGLYYERQLGDLQEHSGRGAEAVSAGPAPLLTR